MNEAAAILDRKAAPRQQTGADTSAGAVQEPSPAILGKQGSSHLLGWKHQSCAHSALSFHSQVGTIPSATPETSINSSYKSHGLELAVDQGNGKDSQSWHG